MTRFEKRVLVFGVFDPLHDGHRNFFQQARALGDSLTVVVARDTVIRRLKKREPHQLEIERLAAVRSEPTVTEAQLGDENPSDYRVLATLDFAVLALGYDQTPNMAVAERLLAKRGKTGVSVVRLKPFRPELYKSSILRNDPKEKFQKTNHQE